ncbi:MAG: DUF692 family protein [Myxococcota bacterium]
MAVRTGLSLMPTADFAAAAFPLLEQGTVDVLEWGPDVSEGPGRGSPDWLAMLVAHYARHGALVGHGVTGLVLSVGAADAFDVWLAELSAAVSDIPMGSFSEHLGFSGTASWAVTPPLPIRPDRATIACGVDRLARIRDVVDAPVGLENLALAVSQRDLDGRGALLEALLAPVDGFLHLDLHNLWCAAVNFGRDPVALMERYPLHRVLRIHLSGGSWSTPPGGSRPFRRDTHDDVVPDEVHALLPEALSRCAAAQDVILEQIGGTLDAEAFHADYGRIRRAVAQAEGSMTVPEPPDREGASGVVASPGAVDAASGGDSDHDAAGWQDAFATALAGGDAWAGWPEDLDPDAAKVARALLGRWGRRA